MKAKEVAAMTPEQKRIRIAELCGWKYANDNPTSWICWFIGPQDPFRDNFRSHGELTDAPTEGRRVAVSSEHSLPDYLNDLNAMHDAEKVLSRDEAIKYRLRLAMNSDGPRATFQTVEAAMCHATAAQRADAFLRILG